MVPAKKGLCEKVPPTIPVHERAMFYRRGTDGSTT